MAKAFGVMVLVIAAMAGLLAYLMQRNSESAKPVESVERDFTFDLNLRLVNEERKVQGTINGAEQEPFSGKKEAKFVVKGGRGRHFLPTMLPKVDVRYWYPCGWRDMVVEVSHPEEFELRLAEEEKRNIVIGVFARDPYDRMTFYVDNRGQPEKLLKLGALEVPIAANERPSVILPVDTRCAEGRQVSLNGRVVAEVPAPPASREEGQQYFTFVLDTTGKRSYCLRVVSYGAPVSDGQPRYWGSGQYLHRITDPVSYVLVDAPSVIQSRVGVETRSALNEC